PQAVTRNLETRRVARPIHEEGLATLARRQRGQRGAIARRETPLRYGLHWNRISNVFNIHANVAVAPNRVHGEVSGMRDVEGEPRLHRAGEASLAAAVRHELDGRRFHVEVRGQKLAQAGARDDEALPVDGKPKPPGSAALAVREHAAQPDQRPVVDL